MTDAAPVTDAAVVRPRSYTAALVLLAVGAVLLLLASGRGWATLVVADPGLPSITVVVTGSELTYGQPLALLALAGIAGLVALRRVGRVVAGLVLLLASGAALVSVVAFGATHASAGGAGGWIAAVAGERAGVAVDASGADIAGWWVVELVGVMLVAAAGVLSVVASRRWPRLGRRYERDGGGQGAGAVAAAPATASAWDQLDAGIDPTVEGIIDDPLEDGASATPDPPVPADGARPAPRPDAENPPT